MASLAPGAFQSRLAPLSKAIAAAPRWAILLFAALAARAITLGNPLVHVDEEFYFVTAGAMLDGAIPYVDVWDRKPIGLFLIYLPAAALGVPLGIWAYQAIAMACVVGTALVIARLADRAGWSAGALPAAIAYIFWLNWADGQGGQAPVFYNLLVAGAVLLIAPRPEDADVRDRLRRGLIAMALVGLAMQVKYSVVFEGMFLGLWLMWREWRLGASLAAILGRGAALAGVALAPTILAWAAFAGIGHGDAFVYANFTSILDRRSDPLWELARNLLKLVAMLSPLVALSYASSTLPAGDPAHAPVRHLLFGWLIAAILGLLLFGSWFNHYALPVMVPAALCAAGFLGNDPRGRKLIVPLLLLGFFAGQISLVSLRAIRGGSGNLDALVQTIGRGPGCLYVYSGTSMTYAYTGRCRVSPWVFPSHITRTREDGALGVDQHEELERIFAKKPQYVVMRPRFPGEKASIRLQALRHIVADYRLDAKRWVGASLIRVYRRRAPAAQAASERLASRRPE